MTLTVVRPDDLADRILDRDKHSQWQGERTKMVYAFPADEVLWSKYAEIRAEGLRQDRGIAEATELPYPEYALTWGGAAEKLAEASKKITDKN